jgi:hypothetical protein
VCAGSLERRRPISEDRWCASCVEEATGAGVAPLAPGRALVLVATGFCGPERRVADPGHGTAAPHLVRYPGSSG